MNITEYKFFKKLISIPTIEEIWLFGSRARNENRGRSDIDLCIVCPKASKDDWRHISAIIDQADTLLKIDCIRLDSLLENDPLLSSILQDKIILYQKGKSMAPFKDSFTDLGKALQKLSDILKEPLDKNSYVIDATLQRFEFSVELFWKVLKKICEREGLEPKSPRATLQSAYTLGLIDDEKIWLDMMEDRNLTSHTYREALAQEIYNHVKNYSVVMDMTYSKLQSLQN